MSETEANSMKGGGGRSIVYIVIAIVVIALVYYATTSYQAGQAPTPQPVVEELAPAGEAAPETAQPDPAASEDIETQRQDVLSPEFNPFEF